VDGREDHHAHGAPGTPVEEWQLDARRSQCRDLGRRLGEKMSVVMTRRSVS
jgi:hypothetical protein